MEKLGATGNFPEGKICEEDEGELKIAVFAHPDDKAVYIQFGKKISWLAYSKEGALEFAEAIRKHAEKLDGL